MSELINKLKNKLKYLNPPPAELKDEERRNYLRNRRIALSGISATLAKLVAAIAGILNVPMVIGYVGKQQYGLWMAVSSIVVWMQLADIGLSNGLTNSLAEANGRDDMESAGGYLTSALVATLILAVVFALIMIASYHVIPFAGLLNLSDPSLIDLAKKSFLVVASAFIINIPVSLSVRVLDAFQRSYISQIIQICSSITLLFLFWLAIKLNADFLVLLGISASLPIVANLASWFFIPATGVKVNFSGMSKSHLFRLSNSSVPLFVFQIGGLFVNQLINVVIAKAGSLTMVADFNVYYRIYLFVFSLSAGLSNPFYSAIRSAFERREIIWVRRALKLSVSARIAVIIPFYLVFSIFGDTLVSFWLGKTLIEPMGYLGWAVFFVCLVFSSVNATLSEILLILDDIWIQVIFVLLSALILFSIMNSFVDVFGLRGVYGSFAISIIIPVAWSTKRLLSKLEKF